MQSNSKKSIVKETRKIRARLSEIKGCSGEKNSRSWEKLARNSAKPVENEFLFGAGSFCSIVVESLDSFSATGSCSFSKVASFMVYPFHFLLHIHQVFQQPRANSLVYMFLFLYGNIH